MADLGTIAARYGNTENRPSLWTMPYLDHVGHFPARISGRACNFYSNANPEGRLPFSPTPQLPADADGFHSYFNTPILILWAVAPGARSFSIPARHYHAGAPTPTLTLDPDALASITAQQVAAPQTPNQFHTLTLNCSPTVRTTLRVWLSMPNATPLLRATWGDITTT